MFTFGDLIMSVIYQKKVTTAAPTDRFSKMLHETQDYFSQKYKTNIVGRNFEDVLTDTALYEAKRNGKGKYKIYNYQL